MSFFLKYFTCKISIETTIVAAEMVTVKFIYIYNLN